MSHRVLFVRTYIAGAALFGSLLAYNAANAQVGCCEGGSAIGANAWTAGNVQEWPAGSSPLVGPQWQWPVPAEGYAGLKDDAPEPYWWTHGEIEIGGRDFVNNPRVRGEITGDDASGNAVHLGQQSLAKYYEYSIQAPGAFGGGHFAMGSSDGLYQLDFWANNVGANFDGFSDQSYMLTANKVGEHYLTVQWDQTAHIYSTDAQTPYYITSSQPASMAGLAGVTSGARYLTLGSNFPVAGIGNLSNPTLSTYAGILPYLHGMDLGIQRDTISFAYRWTPTDNWDFNVDYLHRDRYGTQPGAVAALIGYSATQPTQIPVPIDDTTQNYGVSGERIGETPWGKYTFNLGYSGSTYTDNISSYFVQSPFYPTTANCVKATSTSLGTSNCVAAQMSTPPSNQSNGVSATVTADLPYNTRYAGTLSYTEMTQNQTFLPMTDNPNAGVAPSPYSTASNPVNWNQVNYGFINGNPLLPATSLNGDIQTVLSNNVFTTRITPDLTSKFTYRFYDYDNGTPNIEFPCMLHEDSTGLNNNPASPCAAATVKNVLSGNTTNGQMGWISSLSMGYIKQDVGENLNWRPDREWNFNADYNFERYDWTQVPVMATNENSVKASADWKPSSWFDARLSGYYASRSNEGYDYYDMANIQFPLQGTTVNGQTVTLGWCTQTPANQTACASPMMSSAYREMMWSDRDQTKVNFLTNITLLPKVTISPSVRYQDDNYGVDPSVNVGLKDVTTVSAGIDAVYTPTTDLSLSLSYYWESYNTLLYTTTATGGVYTPSQLLITHDNQYVNTVVAAMNYAVIPNKLNFDVRASVSDGIDQQSINGAGCGTTANAVCGAYPNDWTLFEHVEANITYKLDPALLGDMGYKDMKLKLRYMWERNAVANWQNDALAPYTPLLNNQALWMAYDNPNYNVQAVSASLIFQW